MQIAKNEIRTGLLVVLSVAIVVGVLLYLSAPGLFTPMRTFHIYFDNASGIEPGATVYLAGRKVGRVTRLFSPVPIAQRPKVPGGEKFEVLIDVDVEQKAEIFKNVTVRMLQYGVLSELVIDFTSGDATSGFAENGYYYVGIRDPGITEAVPAILEKIDPVVKSATDTLNELRHTAKNLSDLTGEDSEFNLALIRFRTLGDNLVKLSADDGELHRTLANVQALTGPDGELAKSLANVNQFTTDLTNNQDIDQTLENLQRASARLDRTIDQLGPQFGAISTNLEQMTDTLKRQPWRLIYPTTKTYPEASAPPTPAPKTPARAQAPVRSRR